LDFDGEVQREIESLLEQADPRVLERGYQLFREASFLQATRHKNRFQARMRGSAPYPYRVFLDLDAGSWGCTCPYRWGPVCKHVVALAYAALEAPEIFAKAKSRRKKAAPLLEALLELPEDDLIELLWQLEALRPELLEEFAFNLIQRIEE
jgi:uncharacterized Zn finger protein